MQTIYLAIEIVQTVFIIPPHARQAANKAGITRASTFFMKKFL